MSANHWFYSQSGKAVGPKTHQEISALISEGKIKSSDLVFKEGDKEWKAAQSYSEFLNAFKSISGQSTPAQVDSSEMKIWVLLVRSLEETLPGKPKFLQSGPFSKTEILKKIRTGEARWTDHVWKQGFPSWVRLSTVGDFNSDLSFLNEEDEVTQTATDLGEEKTQTSEWDLLANVQSQKRENKTESKFGDIEKPKEAEGKDLAETPITAAVRSADMLVVEPKVEQKAEVKAETKAEEVKAEEASPKEEITAVSLIKAKFSSAPKKQKIELEDEVQRPVAASDSGIVIHEEDVDTLSRSGGRLSFLTTKRILLYGGTSIALAFILSAVMVYEASEVTQETASVEVSNETQVAPSDKKTLYEQVPIQQEPTRDIAQAPPPPPVPNDVPVASAETGPPPKQVQPAMPPAPAYVKIVPLKLDSNKPQLAVESNTEPGEPIKIRIRGAQGQILRLVRFDKTTQVARKAQELATLDLSKWNLPQGTYTVEARSGGASDSQQIFIGLKNRQFQTQLNKHKKELQTKRAKEKKQLDDAISYMIGLSQKIQKNYASTKGQATLWKSFFATWKKDVEKINKTMLNNYKPERAESFVYSELYVEMKERSTQLLKLGSQYDQAVRSKRLPASIKTDAEAFRNDLKKLRSKL